MPHTLDPGSPSWTIRQELKNAGLSLARTLVQFSPSDPAWPMVDSLRFIAERLENTMCFESVDVDYLIQRTIGGLAVLMRMSGLNQGNDESFGQLNMLAHRTLEQMHTLFMNHRNRHIDAALAAIRDATTTIKVNQP